MSDEFKDRVRLSPVKGKGMIHLMFHGGPQPRMNRVVLFGSGTFVELQRGVEEMLGGQSGAVLYDAGIKSGKEAWDSLHSELKTEGEHLIEKFFALTGEGGLGWFHVEELNIISGKARGSVSVKYSFIADTYERAEAPVCHFIAGVIAGFVSKALGVEVMCEETACRAVSGWSCVFEWEPAA
jgi:predicted hydrocarbon binding protein